MSMRRTLWSSWSVFGYWIHVWLWVGTPPRSYWIGLESDRGGTWGMRVWRCV